MSLKDKQSTWQSITGFSGQPVTLLSRKWFLFVNAMRGTNKKISKVEISVCMYSPNKEWKKICRERMMQQDWQSDK
jgi:hypothetical protein